MTSTLYPRLLDSEAARLHSRYKYLPVEKLTRLHASSHPAAVFTATGGARVSERSLAELRTLLVRCAEGAGFPGTRRDLPEFDIEVARLLHERCGLVAAEAAIRPIWAFLALVVLPDVSYWRYPDPPGDRVLATDITRHVWGRLWWRAHLLAVPSPQHQDPYRLLHAIGEADFDQIYARRALLGGSRRLIRVLVEAWPSVDRDGLPGRVVLRELLKRLLRTAAVVEFDAMTVEELQDEIVTETARSVVALRGGGYDPPHP